MKDAHPSAWLEPLLSPLDLDTFRREWWTQRAYFDGPRPERNAIFQSLFPSYRIEDVLQSHAGEVRVWLSTPAAALTSIDLPVPKALALHACGLTLYAVDHLSLSPYAEQLARTFHCYPRNIHGSIFANRAGTSTPMHFDAYENFTIQLAGRKRWHVAPNDAVSNPVDNWVSGTETSASLRRYTSPHLHRSVPRPTATYELEPGSMLYLPRGFWHGTDADDESCVSVNFSLRPTTWSDVALGAVSALMVKSPRWRAAALGLDGSDARAISELRELLVSLSTALNSLDPVDVLGDDDQACGSASRYRHNPLSTLGLDQFGMTGGQAFVEVTTELPLGPRVTRFLAHEELVGACAEIAESVFANNTGPIDWRARLAGRVSAEDLDTLLDELCAAGFLKGVR